MSGHPQGQYDEGYGHHPQNTDSYYQDEHNQGYYDQGQDYQQGGHSQEFGHQQQHGSGGYYDES
jgi:1,3-beta-glucan synthase